MASRVCLLLLLLFVSGGDGAAQPPAGAAAQFNVKAFGAVADGETDDSKAFLAAWAAACEQAGGSKMVIPNGTFFLYPVDFSGPCNGPVAVEMEGTVAAPPDLHSFPADKDEWIAFNHVDRLLLSVSFNYVSNSTVEKIRSINSKQFHLHVFACNNLTLRGLEITAPAESPNTDGVHIGDSAGVKSPTAGVVVSGVVCGPGHGFRVGSLGGSAGDEAVAGVTVMGCNLTRTDNGVRIKTWERPYALSAANLVFQDITMSEVRNPIIIDQHYCPEKNCKHKTPSEVKISNVRFQNISGSSSTKVAINLSCSEAEPCEDIQLIDINLAYVNRKEMWSPHALTFEDGPKAP
ncbi:unnamed protein product [Spirodela intermedia]|uniref:Uncharacterized protein n=1 Tax=Spirodela intermedia TaxID=51605 RepID=A0A7I8I8I5_SPIIN|nr:unnamed protein product [Spirodela intermedia]CAA6653949.1 unnamed protein product [Spirodela intermedia]